jgi:hypothetical protein
LISNIITWLIPLLAFLVSLWNAYQSRPSLSVEITDTSDDANIFITVQNLSNRICKIKKITVTTCPLASPDKSLTLGSSHYRLINALSENGYDVSPSFDLSPSVKLLMTFCSYHEEKDSSGVSWFGKNNINTHTIMSYEIIVYFTYFKIPFAVKFLFQKHWGSITHVGKFHLIHSKENINWPAYAKVFDRFGDEPLKDHG